MINKTYEVHSPEQTEAIGRSVAEALDGRADGMRFVALFGEMGVGKTAFTRGFASAFGIRAVKSPTYTVVNEYRGEKTVYHFDFYRLADADDLLSIGYDDYVASGAYCIAEWSERIPDELPPHRLNITISRTDGESGRRIEVTEQ